MKDDFKNLTQIECLAKCAELQKKMKDLRFEAVLGHLENTMMKRTVRRQIARLNTIIHEHNLGIRKD